MLSSGRLPRSKDPLGILGNSQGCCCFLLLSGVAGDSRGGIGAGIVRVGRLCWLYTTAGATMLATKGGGGGGGGGGAPTGADGVRGGD